MAELLGTTPVTYQSWITRAGKINLWERTAERVGRFYRHAMIVLDDIGHDLKGLVPIHSVAPRLGLPQEEFFRRCREQEFDTIDLGILGLWIEENVVEQLGRGR